MITLLQKVFYFQSLCFQVVTMRVSDQCWWSVFTSEWWQSSVITHILGTLLDTLLDILHPPSPFTLLQQAISIKRSNIAHKWWICSKIQSQSIKISLGLSLNSESLTLFNLCFEHFLIPCFLFFLDASASLGLGVSVIDHIEKILQYFKIFQKKICMSQNYYEKHFIDASISHFWTCYFCQ